MRTKISALSLSLTLLVAAAGPAVAQKPGEIVRYDGKSVVRVEADDDAERKALSELRLRLLGECLRHDGAEYIADEEDMKRLREAGLEFDVIVENLQEQIDAERARIEANNALRGVSWYADYKTLAQIETRIDDLVATYPALLTKQSIGQSLDGRDIWAITVDAGVPSDAPALCFNGTQHAREWVSPMTVMYILENLAAGYGVDPEVTACLDSVKFYIIPVVNPDGYLYAWNNDRFWRKNRRDNGDGNFGVDPNRNWDSNFGGPGSSPFTGDDTFRGPSAFSEPETVAIRDFILARPEIVAHIDFHSYSQLVLWPYGYVNDVPADPDGAILETLGTEMSDSILTVHNQYYVPQPAHQLYIASGVATDWVYESGGAFSWTIELRPANQFQGGFELPADQLLPTAEENFEAIKQLAISVGSRARFSFAQGPPTLLQTDVAQQVDYEVLPIASAQIDSTTARLFARASGEPSFTMSPASHLGGVDYQTALSSAVCGSTLEYYFEIETISGEVYRSPTDAPASFYSAEVIDMNFAFADDFEADLGWTVANVDGLSEGAWSRGLPLGGGDRGDPAADFDGSGACFLTDPADGNTDVDNGATILTSPAMDASDANSTLVYSRWYSNTAGSAPGEDVFIVEVSDDDGANWTTLETIGPTGADTSGGWIERSFLVSDIAGVSNSSTFRIRFNASDYGEGSVVEAGVDQVQIVTMGCSGLACTGDLDGDGSVGSADLAIVVGTWNSGPGAADFDGDGNIGSADLAILIGLWGPCP